MSHRTQCAVLQFDLWFSYIFMIFLYFLSSTISYFRWVHEGSWFFKTCPFGSGARMVIPNTYPNLSNIVHTDFELGRVIQTVGAADPGITGIGLTRGSYINQSEISAFCKHFETQHIRLCKLWKCVRRFICSGETDRVGGVRCSGVRCFECLKSEKVGVQCSKTWFAFVWFCST